MDTNNNNHHLLDVYYVPITVLGTIYVLFKPHDYVRLVLLLWPFGPLEHQSL